MIAKIVHNDQAGYVKNRYIGDNIRTILGILEITEFKSDPCILVLVDFEKAFDSLSWKFIHKTLEYFNFGENFRKYVKLLYTSPLTAVINNGHLTDYFEISRGIRQGCPVSALLFLLCAEVLAINIRNSENIKGIKCDSSNIKITQYADDTCLFLNNTISLEFALELFENFYRYAGLRLNKDKTEIIWLGKNNRSGKICNIKINNNATKTLGIWISKNTKEIIKTNFEERINKFKLLLQHWKQRNLTLKGRVTILKSPLIVYALCMHLPFCSYLTPL